MRALLLLPFVALAACEPLADPSVPSSDGKPCQSDADCDVPRESRSVRQEMCGNRMVSPTSKTHEVDDAACGPMGGMSPSSPEPQVLCFKGTCVAVGTKR
ncbi:MAG: hypothetical protein U0441_26875 [Polyangiaceae bacterium]